MAFGIFQHFFERHGKRMFQIENSVSFIAIFLLMRKTAYRTVKYPRPHTNYCRSPAACIGPSWPDQPRVDQASTPLPSCGRSRTIAGATRPGHRVRVGGSEKEKAVAAAVLKGK